MRTLVLLLALCAACLAPAPDLGTVRVGVDDSLSGTEGWTPEQRAAIVDELVALHALGPAWVLTTPGDADVVVRAAALADGACGRYTPGLRYVEVDAACAAGFDGLRRAAGHELAHWLTWTHWGWAGHLCDWPANVPPPPGCHASITCLHGACLLAPGLRGTVTATGEDYQDTYASGAVEAPDVELIRRCAARGRCE
jgi:hypothetical protein